MKMFIDWGFLRIEDGKLLGKVNKLVRMGFMRKGVMDILISTIRFNRLKSYRLVLILFDLRIKFNRMSMPTFQFQKTNFPL